MTCIVFVWCEERVKLVKELFYIEIRKYVFREINVLPNVQSLLSHGQHVNFTRHVVTNEATVANNPTRKNIASKNFNAYLCQEYSTYSVCNILKIFEKICIKSKTLIIGMQIICIW